MTNYTAQAHQLTNWLEKNLPTGLSSLRVKRKKKTKQNKNQRQQQQQQPEH